MSYSDFYDWVDEDIRLCKELLVGELADPFRDNFERLASAKELVKAYVFFSDFNFEKYDF